jgi:hypothetical protein
MTYTAAGICPALGSSGNLDLTPDRATRVRGFAARSCDLRVKQDLLARQRRAQCSGKRSQARLTKQLAPIRKYASGNHAAAACQRRGKRTCPTFAGNTTAMRLEERAAGHSRGAWELGFLRLFHRENFGSGLGGAVSE